MPYSDIISRDSFEAAFHYAAIGMLLVGIDGKWLKVNPALCDIIGYDKDELREIDLKNIIHKDDLDKDKIFMKEMLSGKRKNYQMEKRYFHKKGNILWGLLSVSLIKDKQNNPLYFIAQIQNITKRKETENELERTKERFDFAMKASSFGFWDWDLNTDELFWSDRFKEIIGSSDKNFIPHFKEFEARLHKDDLDATLQAIDSHLKKRTPFNVEYRLQKTDGQYIWIHAKGQAKWDKEGKPIRMAGSVDDITNKKDIAYKLEKAEYTRETFIESSYDGYWDWHIKEDYEYMSPRFWEMFGYKPEEKKHHPSEWMDIINKDDLKLALENFDKHVKTKGKHPYSQEARYKHKNGSDIYILCRGKVIEWDKDDNPIRMVGTHTDLTELKSAKKKLEEYAYKLEKSNEALDYFAYVTSHDLKEPLRGLSNNALFL